MLCDVWAQISAKTENDRGHAERNIEDARQFMVWKFTKEIVGAAQNLRRRFDHIPAAVKVEPIWLRQVIKELWA